MFTKTPYTVRKQSKIKKKLDTDLWPVLSAEKLLAMGRQQALVQDTLSLVKLLVPEEEAFFTTAIHQFAEYVQHLPETPGSYYSHKGGLLDHGLERAYLALSRCRSYMAPKDATAINLPQQERLWIYAVFTAALLLDVGRVPVNLMTSLYEQDGEPLMEWNAYLGLMPFNARYYKFRFDRENWEQLRIKVTPLIAQQLISKELAVVKNYAAGKISNGFNWIASDKRVLEAWFSMLQQEHAGKTAILSIIPAIQAQTIACYFADFGKYLGPGDKGNGAAMFPLQKPLSEETSLMAGLVAANAANSRLNTIKLDEIQLKEMTQQFDLANRFLTWLRDQVAREILQVNNLAADTGQKADIRQRNNGQIFVSQAILDNFLKQNQDILAKYGNRHAVVRQLISLDIIEKQVRLGFMIKSWCHSLQQQDQLLNQLDNGQEHAKANTHRSHIGRY